MIKPDFESEFCTLYRGDALQVMASLPDNSIDLIATDPPYFKVKKNDWDNQWKNATTFLDWMGELCQQWKRILKPNGSLYVFASPQMSARVECKIGEYFNVLNNIRWLKEAGWHNKTEKESLRGFLEPWESVVFAEQFDCGGTGLNNILNDLELFPKIRAYFWQERQKISNLSYCDINKQMGTASNGGGMASNILNSYKANWTFPCREMYNLLSSATGICKEPYDFLLQQYEDLRREYEDLRREYEDLRRPFNVTAQVPFTDVWDFKTVKPYAGKHVCEKPLAMMEHIINSSSRAGGVVLDCFAGSGTTLEAAQQLGRTGIGIEMDAHWCGQIETRLAQRDLFSDAAKMELMVA